MRTAYYETKANRLLITFSLKFKVLNLLNLLKSIRKAFFYVVVSFLTLRIFKFLTTQLLNYLLLKLNSVLTSTLFQ